MTAATVQAFGLLRERPVLVRLLAGQGLSSLADWLLAVVLTVLVYSISHSGITVSLLTFTRLAPYALVLPWAGLILDRTDRGLLMAGLGAGRALCMLGLLAVHSSATLPLVFPLVFVSSSFSCLLRPTVSATLPGLVPGRDLVAANGLVTLLDGAAHVIGPGLAGVFVLVHDPPLALLVTAAAFGLSGVSFFAATLPANRQGSGREIDLSLAEVLAGFRFLLRENQGVLIALTAAAAGLALLAGAYYVLAVVLCTQTFHLGGQGVGWLDAAYGVGGLGGSVLVTGAVRGRRVSRLFVAGAALSSGGALVLALSPPGPLPFVCIAVVGMAGVLVQVTGTTMLQAGSPGRMLGRVFTAFEASLVVAMVVGALTAGPLVGLAGPRTATAAFSLTGAALLVAALPRLRRVEEVLGLRVFLRGVPVLADLPRPILDEVAPRFEALSVPAGTTVVRQGEWGDRLYIIQHGEAEVSVNGRVVRRVGPAGYFGEVALLLDIPRTATVRAVAPTDLYSLEKASFQKLMRQAEELEARLASQIETYELYSDRLIPL